MTVDLFLDEKMFISVKRASQETGYSQDYIGQLSRKGKIPAKLIGRSWFVNIDSLKKYRQSSGMGDSITSTAHSNIVDNKEDLGSTSYASAPIAFTNEDLNIPKLVNKSRAKSFFGLGGSKFLVGSAGLVAVFVFFGSSYNWIKYLDPSFFDRFDSGVASYYEKAVSSLSNVRVAMSSFSLAQVGSVDGAGVSEEMGIVVLPNTEDNQERIDLVKQNFSDDVEVYFDKDDQSGVIKPVFRSSQISEDYAFVIVPIKESK